MRKIYRNSDKMGKWSEDKKFDEAAKKDNQYHKKKKKSEVSQNTNIRIRDR